MKFDADDGVQLDRVRRNPILAVGKIEKTEPSYSYRFCRLDERWRHGCRSELRICCRLRGCRQLETELIAERLPGGSYLLGEETARSQRGRIRYLRDHGIALTIGYDQMIVAV